MHSSLPKILHHLAGEPLLGHVIATAQQLIDHHGGRIRVVTGHGAEQVDPFVESAGAEVVHQYEQLGTGHALQVALNDIEPEGQTLVLYGDVPLIQRWTSTSLVVKPPVKMRAAGEKRGE